MAQLRMRMHMKLVRISVRAPTGRERDLAVEILSHLEPQEVHVYDGLVTGFADRAVLQEVMEAGLMVDRSSASRDDPPPEQAPGVEETAWLDPAGPFERLLERARSFSPPQAPRHRDVSSRGGRRRRVPAIFKVQLIGPMRPDWREFFHSAGIPITPHVPPYRYRMSLTRGQQERVRAQNFVAAVEPYEPRNSVTPELLQLLEEHQKSPTAEPAVFDLMVHVPEQAATVVQIIEQSGVGILETVSGRLIRFRAPALSPLVGALTERTEVNSITPFERLMEGAGSPSLARLPSILKSALAAPAAAAGLSAVFEVQLMGPMRPEWREFFSSAGIAITSYVPPYRYRMSLAPEQEARLRAQGFVASVEPYDPRDTVTPELLQLLEEQEKNPTTEPAVFDLMVHAPEQAAAVVQMIEQSGEGTLEKVSGRFIRFRARALSPLLGALTVRTEVKSITPYRPAALLCDIARGLIGIPAVNGAAGGPWEGTGEVVGLIDSGADTGHPDLAGRIKSYHTVLGATATDRYGHGTHIAGIICGTGADSGGKIKGVAPEAELVVIGIVDASNRPQLPQDMGVLLKMAVDDGARIVNLSLGSYNPGYRLGQRYDQCAESIDQFVFENPEVLVVVAAGNSGTAKQGFPDYNSLATPATAKNVITVGACVTVRNGFTKSWGQYQPALFSGAPVDQRLMTGPPLLPAASSSRGPTDFSTVKPDLLAPGTYILSAQAGSAVLSSFAPVAPGTGRYIYLNGTSMAAPFVSGAAAVLRQYLRQVLGIGSPSAALLKALLCGAVVRCPSMMSAAVEPRVGYPDFDQGMGRLELSTILPHRDSQGLRLSFRNVANGSEEALESRVLPGSLRRAGRLYKVQVASAGSPLRVILAWTDAAGRSLQNTLQLDVKGPNVHLVGNHEHTYMQDPLFQTAGVSGTPFDRKNNVQVVNLKAAAAGEYSVNVLADNTLNPAQGYALCVVGRLAADLTEPPPAF